MANISSGQYEVILRKKYKSASGTLVPLKTKIIKGTKKPEESYHLLYLCVEFRSDIIENGEFQGKRIEIQKLYKTTDTYDNSTLRKDGKLLKEIFDSVDATSDYTMIDLAETMINKPVLVDIIAENKEKYGWQYQLKSITKTRVLEVQPSALEDPLDTLETTTKEQEAALAMYDI